ncbi:MAG: competence/damage-inducible protein A [Sulfuricella denitrificans]|nr:competence/damage-inducible protein A [Sulfuricella denitrificans]
MDIGILIIGDEILSGKRRDGHFAHVVEALAGRGLELAWCRIVGDVPARIVQHLRETHATGDLVFSFGGIGATPDDHTRQCAAIAADVPMQRHPDAVSEIEAQFGPDAYPRRILMADLPAGSTIIPNPVNRVPGFSLRHHHFLPGFPQMAWPMMAWVLDTRYPDLRNLAPEREEIFTALDVSESYLLDLMNEFVVRYPEVRFSSLPHLGADGARRIEFGLRGRSTEVTGALLFLQSGIAARGYRWQAGRVIE